MRDPVRMLATAPASLESRPGMAHCPAEPTVSPHDHTHTQEHTLTQLMHSHRYRPTRNLGPQGNTFKIIDSKVHSHTHALLDSHSWLTSTDLQLLFLCFCFIINYNIYYCNLIFNINYLTYYLIASLKLTYLFILNIKLIFNITTLINDSIGWLFYCGLK